MRGTIGLGSVRKLASSSSRGFVLSGLTGAVPSPASATMTLSAGKAVVDGRYLEIGAAAHVYAANLNTMVDLTSTGELVYTTYDPVTENPPALVEPRVRLCLVDCTGPGGTIEGVFDLRDCEPAPVIQAPTSRHVSLSRAGMLDLLSDMRVTAGAYSGAYLLGIGGYINWYFANIGLVPFVADITANVTAYMDAYVAASNANGNYNPSTNHSIRDVEDPTGTPVLRGPDADDSYAATFLSLVRAHQLVAGNGWATANLAKLKNIASFNLVAPMDLPTNQANNPDALPGLTRVFQRATDPTWAPSIQFLMDNCETWAGLNDFAATLTALADGDAAYYQSFADAAANGVFSLYNGTDHIWRVSTYALDAPGTTWYPDAVAQCWPELWGVPTASASLRRQAYSFGYTRMNQLYPGWWNRVLSPDAEPWMSIALVAAKRGDYAEAQRVMERARRYYAPANSHLLIHDLGHYRALLDLVHP